MQHYGKDFLIDHSFKSNRTWPCWTYFDGVGIFRRGQRSDVILQLDHLLHHCRHACVNLIACSVQVGCGWRL